MGRHQKLIAVIAVAAIVGAIGWQVLACLPISAGVVALYCMAVD